MLSFSLVTLVGTALLSLLHLPQDAIRWAGLVALTAIGLGLIFPRFEQILEKPFSRIPQLQVGQGKSGFGLGLALGVLYVPCAGPVLAAIVVAGATGSIGLDTVALTLSFAIGAALPLLFFALAGQRVAERVGAFRRHQRRIRLIGGIVMLAFAVALVFNVPAKLQRAIPDYTSGLQNRVWHPTRSPKSSTSAAWSTTRTRSSRTAPMGHGSSKAAVPHRISRASPVGSTPRAAHRST